MTDREQVRKLQELASLILEHRLGLLRDASAELERSKSQLLSIDGYGPSTDLSIVVAGTLDLNYRRWADARKSELNQVIARQTVDWLTAREAARVSFSRLEALRALVNSSG